MIEEPGFGLGREPEIEDSMSREVSENKLGEMFSAATSVSSFVKDRSRTYNEYIFKYDKYEVDSAISKWFEKEFHIGPFTPFETRVGAGRPLAVKFESQLDSIAAYDTVSNEILAGIDMVVLTRESIEAALAHEKSHMLFSELPKEKQAQLVETVIAEHPEGLALFYSVLRQGYDEEYFGYKKAMQFSEAANKANKDRYIRFGGLDNRGRRENIDIALVVDELFAFANTGTRAEDFLGSSKFMQGAASIAWSIADALPAEAKSILEDKDMIDLKSDIEADVLLGNPYFRRMRVLYDFIMDHPFSVSAILEMGKMRSPQTSNIISIDTTIRPEPNPSAHKSHIPQPFISTSVPFAPLAITAPDEIKEYWDKMKGYFLEHSEKPIIGYDYSPGNFFDVDDFIEPPFFKKNNGEK